MILTCYKVLIQGKDTCSEAEQKIFLKQGLWIRDLYILLVECFSYVIKEPAEVKSEVIWIIHAWHDI